MKTKHLMCAIALACFAVLGMHAQSPLPEPTPVELEHKNVPTNKDFNLIYADTLNYVGESQTVVVRDTILDPMRVVTNHFGKNWFIFGTAGAHTFRGDYSSIGDFGGTVSFDWSAGIGKWFTPGVALKLEFIRSESRGYTEYLTGHYGYGDMMQAPDGTPYRKMKTGWWDISGSVILNFTRLFLGYEGIGNKKHMNQFMGAFGLGGVHHLGFEHGHGSDNEWSAHVELQYSRFFTPSKRFSLDFKLRGIFYQTNFDLEYGQGDHAANKWDSNLGADIGFTFYLGSKRPNGWGRATTAMYQRDFRQRDVLQVLEAPVEKQGPVDYGTITFYVFYPNNYSGRNDAPQIADAKVNALDYLAGGIFTQKKFANNGDVALRLSSGVPVHTLSTVDLETEPANRKFEIDYVPRGYEMLQTTPMSLSMEMEPMASFREKAGFYYAPIWDGQHTWHYRIDDATLGQQLISGENYKETDSYGLNAHSGLPTILERMDVDGSDMLVSFADMYAAMNSNEGYVAQFTDQATVDRIRNILDSGVITLIQAEGLATSQDNFTGENAKQVGIDRNTALSQNRANTVITWLKGNERLGDVASQIYLVNSMQGPIRTVTDPSTRGLNAKLNRCVKVKIHYMKP